MHTAALKEDGTVVAWGSNNSGQLTIPAGLSGVKAISVKGGYTVALKEDGTVVSWGYSNDRGQMVVPTGLSGVKAVSAGNYHTVALKKDGTIVTWGFNDYDIRKVPAGLSDVKAIAAGNLFTVALFDIPSPDDPAAPKIIISHDASAGIVQLDWPADTGLVLWQSPTMSSGSWTKIAGTEDATTYSQPTSSTQSMFFSLRPR